MGDGEETIIERRNLKEGNTAYWTFVILIGDLLTVIFPFNWLMNGDMNRAFICPES